MSKAIVDRNKLYALRFPWDKEAAEIIMNAEIDRGDFKGICYLSPPAHGHMIRGKIGNKTKHGFTFIADENELQEWEFTEVTYENLTSKYHKLVYGWDTLEEQIHSTEELEDYYHSNFPDYAD